LLIARHAYIAVLSAFKNSLIQDLFASKTRLIHFLKLQVEGMMDAGQQGAGASVFAFVIR
jgi:hypothetical protein